MTATTHRAREILSIVGRAHPDAWRQHERFRAERGRGGLPDWPQDVYAPIAAALAIASGGDTLSWDRLHHPAILAALAAWRMTQGIYRYDPALYAALVDTTIDGDVPNNALAHLPEWCVYVEMDGVLRWGASPIRGFWAHLECDVARANARELRLLLDTAESPALALDAARGLCPMPIVLGPGSLVDDIQRVIDSGKREAVARDVPLPAQIDSADSIAQALQPMLSLLLYLCSESPDLSRRGEPGTPANPQPVHTRRNGWRVFPVDAPREWDVGVRIGAALRAAYAREQTGGNAAPSGHHVRPHVRRAHWHTILSGPRLRADGSAIPSSERQAALRWLPHIPVNVDDLDTLAATIHPVKP